MEPSSWMSTDGFAQRPESNSIGTRPVGPWFNDDHLVRGWPTSRRRCGADREPRCVSNARRSSHGRYGSRETPQAGPTLRCPDLAVQRCKIRKDDASQRKPSGQASDQMPKSLLRVALSTDQKAWRSSPSEHAHGENDPGPAGDGTGGSADQLARPGGGRNGVTGGVGRRRGPDHIAGTRSRA